MEVSLHIYRCSSMISARSVMATKGRHARSTLFPTLSILVGPWVYLGYYSWQQNIKISLSERPNPVRLAAYEVRILGPEEVGTSRHVTWTTPNTFPLALVCSMQSCSTCRYARKALYPEQLPVSDRTHFYCNKGGKSRPVLFRPAPGGRGCFPTG